VGESTSDVAGCFLTRVLRQHHWLIRNQIPKQGLRFWFTSESNQDPKVCTEMGSFYQVRLPTFQLDRSTLDEHLLNESAELGCEIWRPAKIKSAELNGIGNNLLEVERNGQREQIKTKWVVDASGKAAFLARKHKTLRKLEGHPTHSLWVRFKNVNDLDSYKSTQVLGEVSEALPCARMTATNHLTGYGWWSWIIPLKNGEVSAGLTYDERLFTPPAGASISERLKKHLVSHPIGKLIFENAEAVEKDARAFGNMPYYNDQAAGEGWACVGDAAGFMDPLYSQGLDYCSHSAYNVHNLVAHSLEGQCVKEEAEHYRKEFLESYFRWYNALYKDKYHYLGDAELMWAAFLLDLSTYFLGPVRLVYDQTVDEFSRMPYNGAGGRFFAWWMSVYNRRLTVIAKKRREAGVYGQMNLGKRYFVRQGFAPTLKSSFSLMRQGLVCWLKLEVKTLFLKKPKMEEKPIMAAPTESPSPAM
jgi:flavin-dependent dehydrogenase